MLFKSRNEKSRLWIYLQAAENEVIVGLVSSRGDIVKAVSSIAGLVFLFIWFFFLFWTPSPAAGEMCPSEWTFLQISKLFQNFKH